MACSSGGAPRRPATDAILMILPRFCAIRTLPTACENRNVPVRLVSMTLFQCSRRISSTGAPQDVPALLINTSILPNSETVASTTSWTLPGFFTSQPSAWVLTPSWRNSSAARWHRSCLRAQSTRFAPISARPSAIWRPSPTDPPVMMATRPLRLKSSFVFMTGSSRSDPSLFGAQAASNVSRGKRAQILTHPPKFPVADCLKIMTRTGQFQVQGSFQPSRGLCRQCRGRHRPQSCSAHLESQAQPKLDFALREGRCETQRLARRRSAGSAQIKRRGENSHDIIDARKGCPVEEVETLREQMQAGPLSQLELTAQTQIERDIVWTDTGVAPRSWRAVIRAVPVIIHVRSSQQVERMRAVVTNDRRHLKISEDGVLPGTLKHPRKHDLVPLIKSRKAAFCGKVGLICRTIIAVEIRHLVDRLTVGVAPEQGEVLTHALLNLECSPLVNGSSKGRVLVVLEKQGIHKAIDDVCARAWEPCTRTPLPDGDVCGSSRHERRRQ